MVTTTTQLSNAVIPEVFMSYQAVDSIESSAFYDSGIIVRSELLDTLANAGGTMIDVPFWKDLDQTQEPNYSNDDPDDDADPDKIEADEMVARTAQLNNGWSAADLVSELAGSDPMKRIRNRVETYWKRQWERRLLAAANGVLADNIANHASDMTLDVSIADGDNALDANLFGRTVMTGAVFTLGDQFGKIGAIGVHSIIYKQMVDKDDIEFVPDSAGKLSIPTYLGIRVVIDDNMTVAAGGVSGHVYTSILFGAGAFGYGEGNPKVPVEVWRNPKGGNGGGIEELWSRKTWLIHPFGYKWTNTTVTGKSPTLANLRLAVNWDRVVERKAIPLAFIKTNG